MNEYDYEREVCTFCGAYLFDCQCCDDGSCGECPYCYESEQYYEYDDYDYYNPENGWL